MGKKKTVRAAFEAGEFVVTGECGPPKGTDISEMLHHAEGMLGYVNGINVTDNQSSVMRIGSLPVCKLLVDMGHDPVFQITGRDRNRLAIQSDLLGAHILGIRNVLCLTGDGVQAGDHKDAKPVFDLESVQILQAVEALNNGKDMAGNDLKGATSLFPGAVVTPESRPIEPQLMKFEKKIRAGAKFFQTQAVYDIENFLDFMKFARQFDTKIMAGLVLLTSAGMANYMNKFVPGVSVPQNLIDRMKAAGKEKAIDTGIDIMCEFIKAVRDQCDGVHIMAIGKEHLVPEIVKRAGLA
ncbi:MAG: 5,10-methylenetetrahydrofolate reductase [Nitrospirae bacterium CG_4_9_14_3_um_filter_53_35]|nr:MAG: 5,10-methylenetetrahydrofolate reductase [Nitrospirae bacterium CG2_30_53_67]PIS36346.1 MAG: 5,10-methylenetetrahydrofolate reductase [Nitrospirae bacterium CG08_land_8_20_14_0_20_52_24]PIV84753.1 MAG: 5,10-methylenetetrahydrofolate reductase [Nitrospirae bacterium CG17_big_fil_post_rev_8_21_14_2_50_50_9]PIW84817.1 MAG: 5,10-methylenetetrahydrofolate reductase [Nitrospirae bacterium CG_4_8_14_3_um_filter_50_41]PIX84862.1 MAG: 5,10-methylenetetrahydrofolate reductase [Nitrospirae bacteri